jgi:hypothetical protein
LRRAVFLENGLAFGILFRFAVEPPVLLRKREIRAYSVKLTETAIVVKEFRVFNRVALPDLSIQTMQENIDARDSPSIPDGFLTKKAQAAGIAARFFHKFCSID